MAIRTVLAVAAVAAAASVPAPASAVDPAPGLTCGFHSVLDPGTESGTVQTGVVFGGPLAVPGGGSGTLTCTVQPGGSTHAPVAGAASRSASGSGVVALAPDSFSVLFNPTVPIYVCTRFTSVSGTTSYWHSDGAGAGRWSSSATASCRLATEITAGPLDTTYGYVATPDAVL